MGFAPFGPIFRIPTVWEYSVMVRWVRRLNLDFGLCNQTNQISKALRISSNYATHCVGDNVLTNRPHELIFLVAKGFGGVY